MIKTLMPYVFKISAWSRGTAWLSIRQGSPSQ